MTSAAAVTVVQLRQLAPQLAFDPLTLYTEQLNQALAEWGIDRPARVAAFLGQTLHESTGYSRWVENLHYTTPSRLQAVFPRAFPTQALAQWYVTAGQEAIANRVYAEKNGNGPEGSWDGWTYRGRGPIGLTGRGNYLLAEQALGVPLVEEPERAADPDVGFRVAAWFWAAPQAPRARPWDLNALADQHSVRTYRQISYAINGVQSRDPNGWADRLLRWYAACGVLGLRLPAKD